ESRIVVGPRLRELRSQFPTVQHVVVGLHERRRTPRAGKKSESAAGGGQRPFGERNAESPVVIDVERLQLLVAFSDVRVAGRREIAAVDVRPPERVADALVWVEIG